MKWNLFKEQRFIEIPWDKKEYENTIRWASDTVNKIKIEEEWGVNKELIKAQEEGKSTPFYCLFLCSQRKVCPFKDRWDINAN